MTWRTYLIVFILALLLYAASAGVTLFNQSNTPQYVDLANAFLHGRIDLSPAPVNTYDLIYYQGHWYVPEAILPAILLLPFVALGGPGVSDILFGVLVGAVNVVLIYDLLGYLDLKNHPASRKWLTLLFAAGTVHWGWQALGRSGSMPRSWQSRS